MNKKPPFDPDQLSDPDYLWQALCEPEWRGMLVQAVGQEPNNGVLKLVTRTPFDNDPCPPWSATVGKFTGMAWLVTDAGKVADILRDPHHFSNAPFRLLGSPGRGGFMLGLDPISGPGSCPHQSQRMAANLPDVSSCERLIALAWQQASSLGLSRSNFCLAALAEQVALRFTSLLFGLSMQDHLLLQQSLRSGYLGLCHLSLWRHFVHDPLCLPKARSDLGLLTQRVDKLLQAYRRIKLGFQDDLPSLHDPHPERSQWPAGVTPYSELGLSGFSPLLRQWADSERDEDSPDYATLAVGLMAGTVGNMQSAICLCVEAAFAHPTSELQQLLSVARGAVSQQPRSLTTPTEVSGLVRNTLGKHAPVPFLPRVVSAANNTIPGAAPGDDVILMLDRSGQPPSEGPGQAFGGTAANASGQPGWHACLGESLSLALVEHTVTQVLALPGLAQALHPQDGSPIGLVRKGGFACERFPLRYRRERLRAQQPLQVIMRIKAPVAENTAKLLQLIEAGAPRIDQSLRESRHVHFAWFQLVEGGTHLALQTVYDGDFDAYVQFFALKVDELFDGLFEYIEDAPPRPIRLYPEAFAETIRRYHRAPLGGYFFSAHGSRTLTDGGV